jgi:hypothetical protein
MLSDNGTPWALVFERVAANQRRTFRDLMRVIAPDAEETLNLRPYLNIYSVQNVDMNGRILKPHHHRLDHEIQFQETLKN